MDIRTIIFPWVVYDGFNYFPETPIFFFGYNVEYLLLREQKLNSPGRDCEKKYSLHPVSGFKHLYIIVDDGADENTPVLSASAVFTKLKFCNAVSSHEQI
jgi:hypothetical protein